MIRVRRNTTMMFSMGFQHDIAIKFVNFQLQSALSTVFVTCSNLSGMAKTSLEAAQYNPAIPDSCASFSLPRVRLTRALNTFSSNTSLLYLGSHRRRSSGLVGDTAWASLATQFQSVATRPRSFWRFPSTTIPSALPTTNYNLPKCSLCFLCQFAQG
jgi:hypothetical protein